MSCPDWQTLVEHRYEPGRRPPEGWERAMAHRESCPACRRRSLEADPTLALLGAAGVSVDPGEVEGIRSTVRAMRSARRVEHSRRRHRRRYGSLAAALLLAVLAIWLAADDRGGAGPASSETAVTMRFGELRVPALDRATPPMVETIDRPEARIYQLPQEDLSLVMIVDESLDV